MYVYEDIIVWKKRKDERERDGERNGVRERRLKGGMRATVNE